MKCANCGTKAKDYPGKKYCSRSCKELACRKRAYHQQDQESYERHLKRYRDRYWSDPEFRAKRLKERRKYVQER